MISAYGLKVVKTCRPRIFRNIFTAYRETFPHTQHRNMSSEDLRRIPLVDIDGSGRFKYILIKVFGKEIGNDQHEEKMIVRGYGRCEWHADIYDTVTPAIQKMGFDTECLGGGRIEHNPQVKTLKVFGYSQGFGKADHEESKRILLSKYPDYEITCSDEGY